MTHKQAKNEALNGGSELNAGLAARIARAIFECGDEPTVQVKRIQFMGGQWPDDEFGLGGLNEDALRKVIERITGG